MLGRIVSHYQITERLGAGGMGEIYTAQDTRLNRIVAVKVLNVQAGTGDRRRRFLQEAQAASALNHPNIVTIHDIISEGDTEFLVMELIPGQTLTDLIPAGGLPLSLVLDYAVQIANGLETAHAAGIVHRDLKPGNVMVTGQTSDGRPGLVKILDFGLAKLTAFSAAASATDETTTLAKAPLTVEGSILGTLSYMSPEQAEGKPVDGRSDIFAFGAILHEMVTGDRAFQGDTTVSTLTSILRDEVRPMTQTNAGAPPRLESIVSRCLRKNREDRWQSIGEVRTALMRLKRDSDSGTLIVAPLSSSAITPPSAAAFPPPVRKRSRLNVVLAVLAGVGAFTVLVVAILVFGVWAIVKTSSHSGSSRNKPEVSFPASGAAASKTGEVLTNDDVIKMVNADVAPKLIIEQIRASKAHFDLSTSEIIRLTRADVPSEVIEAMRKANRTPAPAPPVAVAKSVPPPVAAPAAPVPPETPELPPMVSVMVPDGTPVAIRLSEDVPVDSSVGVVLHFTAEHAYRAGGVLVVAEGATATGEVVEAARKKLLGGNRMMFRLKDIETAGGAKLVVRATPLHHGEDNRRALETASTAKRAKDQPIPAGTEYVAYVEGDQTVTVRK